MSILFLISLIVFSNSSLASAKEGLILWCNCIVPALFPFFIATELLNYTDIAKIIGKLFNKFMRPLFNVPGVGAYALIMGLISSTPVGAIITLDLYENKLITKNEAERMLAFTNNSGPLFIIGTTGILLFGSKAIGFLLLLTHILSSLTVGFLIGLKSRITGDNHNLYDKNYYKESIGNTSDRSTLDLGSLISLSVKKAISLILQIGGFIVLFSVIISIFNELKVFDFIENIFEKLYVPKDFTKGLLTGMLELTNGIYVAANLQTNNLSLNIILCAFLLAAGGISTNLQVISVVSKSNLRVKTYMKGKLLHGLIAMLYTAILIRFMPIFQLDIKPVSNPMYLSKIILIILTFIVAFATTIIKSNLHHKILNSKYN